MGAPGEQSSNPPREPLLAAPVARSSDAALSKYTSFAINDLTELIREAVSLEDDELVTRLDRVLRHIEAMVELSKGSPNDRGKH